MCSSGCITIHGESHDSLLSCSLIPSIAIAIMIICMQRNNQWICIIGSYLIEIPHCSNESIGLSILLEYHQCKWSLLKQSSVSGFYHMQ